MNLVGIPEQRRRIGRGDTVGHVDASSEKPSSTFRPDIEGLRAVAVPAVVLFHAGMPGIGGGFVGVDVFFVVSGFLITGLLWRDLTSTGSVRVARFFGARRLLPAGGLVLVVTAIGSAFLLPPLQARAALGDGIASALHVGNYRFTLHGTDYLAAATPPSPFPHYWSLGVANCSKLCKQSGNPDRRITGLAQWPPPPTPPRRGRSGRHGGFVSVPSASMIIVAHRDRPARLDVEHPTAALPTQSRRIVTTDQGENHDPVRGIEDPTSPQVV